MSWGALLCIPGISGRKPWGDIWVREGWRVQRRAGTSLHRVLDPTGKRTAQGDQQACLAFAMAAAPALTHKRALILLHGIGRDYRIMGRLEHAAAAQGWAVVNISYPSLTRPFSEHVAQVHGVIDGLREAGIDDIHFIGHSMGGLIARAVMAERDLTCRAVLLGSPNQGAVMAEVLGRYRSFHTVFGPCGLTLSPAEKHSIPIPERAEIAVIAGGTGRGGYNPLLPGDNDSIVTVAETRLPGREADFALIPSLHISLPLRSDVIAASLGFLETGRLTQQAASPLS
ncbi:esterase/lipase family protein [Lacibacterium aquatile]|uniref:Esterase/lipase family protein n=1 Tax=Lacibacterium aquatile TaxID=1168082 RepID=A0ABW5DRX3_9PROT